MDNFLISFLVLMPLVGTSAGALIGISRINKKKASEQESSLTSIATGILCAIFVTLVLSGVQNLKAISFYIGILCGILFIFLMNKITKREELHHKLFWAMVFHNIPEGILLGIALISGANPLMFSIISSISLQNIPDGFVVAAAAAQNKGRIRSFLYGVVSGIIEPIVMIVMLILSSQFQGLTWFEPICLGFAISSIATIIFELLLLCKKNSKRNWLILVVSFVTTLLINLIL